MGGQVIYLPHTPSFGETLGSGVSQGMSKFADVELKRQQEQRDTEANMRALNMMKQAGSRERALEVLSTPGLVPFKNAEEIAHAMRYVDVIYPKADESLTEVGGYGPTGEAVKGYAPKNKLMDQQSILGVLPPGSSLTKPDLEDFYLPASGDKPPTHLGRRPRSDQQPGEYTKAELEMQMQKQAGDRAAESGRRSADAAVRAADNTAVDNDTAQQRLLITKQNAYKNHIADLMNIKKTIGQDGTVSFDFSGEKDQEKINKVKLALKDFDANIKTAKNDVLKAATIAADKYGIADKPTPKEAEAPIEKPKSGIARAAAAVKTAMTGKSDNELEDKAKVAWGAYDSKAYDYRIVGGKIERKKK